MDRASITTYQGSIKHGQVAKNAEYARCSDCHGRIYRYTDGPWIGTHTDDGCKCEQAEVNGGQHKNSDELSDQGAKRTEGDRSIDD